MLFRTTMFLLVLFLIWLLREGVVTMHLRDSLIFSSSILIVVVFVNSARGIVNLPMVFMCLPWWINFLFGASIISMRTLTILILSIRSCANCSFWFDWCCSWKFKRWDHLPLWRCLSALIQWALYILEGFLWLLLLFVPSSAILILSAMVMTALLFAVFFSFFLPNFAHILFHPFSLFSVWNFLRWVFTIEDIWGAAFSRAFVVLILRINWNFQSRTIIEDALFIWAKNLVILETAWKGNFF